MSNQSIMKVKCKTQTNLKQTVYTHVVFSFLVRHVIWHNVEMLRRFESNLAFNSVAFFNTNYTRY